MKVKRSEDKVKKTAIFVTIIVLLAAISIAFLYFRYEKPAQETPKPEAQAPQTSLQNAEGGKTQRKSRRRK